MHSCSQRRSSGVLVVGFGLAAGVLVLLAALQATASERRFESAVLRTLGAGRKQLRAAVLIEFAALGTMAALLAIIAAAITGSVLAERSFGMSLSLPWGTLIAGGAAGVVLAMSAGWRGTRPILSRTEERRGGKECVRTCHSRLSPSH